MFVNSVLQFALVAGFGALARTIAFYRSASFQMAAFDSSRFWNFFFIRFFGLWTCYAASSLLFQWTVGFQNHVALSPDLLQTLPRVFAIIVCLLVLVWSLVVGHGRAFQWEVDLFENALIRTLVVISLVIDFGLYFGSCFMDHV